MTKQKNKKTDWFTWLICVMTVWNLVFAFLVGEFFYFFGGVVHGIALVMALLFVLVKASEENEKEDDGDEDGKVKIKSGE